MSQIVRRLPVEESRKMVDGLGGAEAISLLVGQNVRTIYRWRTQGIPVDMVRELKRLLLSNGIARKPAFDRSDNQGGDRTSKAYKEKRDGKKA